MEAEPIQYPSILEPITSDDLALMGDDDADINETDSQGQDAFGEADEQSFITPGFVPVQDNRTAVERINDLFEDVAPCRRLFMAGMGMCKEAQPVEQVNAAIDEFRAQEYTVFSAASICAQLELAGALDRVTADGQPFDTVDTQPRMVVIDGVEYLEPAEPAIPYWKSTQAALEVLEANNPAERLAQLFEEDAEFLPVYKSILILCDNGTGVTAQQMTAALNSHPILQEAHLLPAHFIEKLEKCDALTWKKAWITTDAGRAVLEEIKDVEAICTVMPELTFPSQEERDASFIDPFDSLEF